MCKLSINYIFFYNFNLSSKAAFILSIDISEYLYYKIYNTFYSYYDIISIDIYFYSGDYNE